MSCLIFLAEQVVLGNKKVSQLRLLQAIHKKSQTLLKGMIQVSQVPVCVIWPHDTGVEKSSFDMIGTEFFQFFWMLPFKLL